MLRTAFQFENPDDIKEVGPVNRAAFAALLPDRRNAEMSQKVPAEKVEHLQKNLPGPPKLELFLLDISHVLLNAAFRQENP